MANFTHEDATNENEYSTATINGTDTDDEVDTTKASQNIDIYAGDGKDIINVASGGHVYGQNGNDVITTYPTNITTNIFTLTWVDGGDGDDVITVTSQGIYYLWGGNGNDKINGGSGGTYINGEAGNDTLYGSDGADTLIGGDGDDSINGGGGNDHIYGGDGIDTAFFNIASTDITFYNQKNGVITIKSGAGTDTVEGIEHFAFSDKTLQLSDMDGAFNRVLAEDFTVGYGNNNAIGNNGDDTFSVYTYFDEHAVIDAKAGNDLIYYHRSGTSAVDGGEGNDTIAYNGNDSFIDAYLENSNALTIFYSSKIDTITNVETIAFNNASYSLSDFKTAFSSKRLDVSTIVGTIDADNLTGTSEDDTFFPFISVNSTGGRDVVDGKEGNDAVILSIATSDVDSYLNQNGEIQISSGGQYQYRLKNIETFKFKDITLSLSDLDNLFVKVNTQDQVILGSNDNDRLFHGLGNDSVDGLGGVDTVVMNTDSSRISQFSESSGTITFVEQSETDTFKNIEYFEFNDVTIAKADLKTAFAAVNTEANTFYTTTKDDSFVGGLSNDTVVLDISTGDVERFSYEKPYLWQEFNPDLNIELTSKSGVDSFSHIENFQFIDQTLTSEQLLDALRQVRVEDQYIIWSAAGQNIYGGLGNDHISPSGNHDLVIFGGDGSDRIFGSFGNDTLHGDDGADTIYGGPEYFNSGTGHDTIFGGAGNDTVYAGDGLNHVDGGEGTDTVVLPFATTEVSIYGVVNNEVQFDGGGVASYKIINVENYQFTDKTLTNNDDLDALFAHVSYNDQTITGTNGDDLGLVGGEGNNRIIPKLGNDTVYGRSGHDTVIFNIASTEVTSYTENGVTATFVSPEGTDEIINVDSFEFTDKTFSFSELSAAFSKVNTAPVTLYGTSGDDELVGGLANDIINSSDGNDLVDGGAGNQDIMAFHIAQSEVKAFSNDNGVITLTYSGSVDTISNIEFFQFTDGSVNFSSLDSTFKSVTADDQEIKGNNSANVLSGALGNDTITPMGGDDIVDGAEGNDTVVLAIKTDQVTSYTNTNQSITLVSPEGKDTFNNVENFQFADKTVSLDELTSVFSKVNTASQTVIGDDEANDLFGGLGDDSFSPKKGDDLVDGVSGDNTAILDINSSEIKGYSNDGINIVLTSTQGIDTFTNISQFKFNDKTIELAAMDKAFALVTVTNKTVEGDDGENTLIGALANDTITPRGGNDDINGAAGEDTVILNISTTDVTDYRIDDNGVVTISSPEGQDRFENVEIFQFLDKTVKLIDLDEALSTLLVKELTFTSTPLNDAFIGGDSDDLLIFGFATSDLTSVIKNGDQYNIAGTEGIDTVSNIESLQFTNKTIKTHDLITGSKAADSVIGTNVDDIIDAGNGLDQIKAGSGDDLIIGNQIGDTVDGGLGIDLAKFQFAQSDVTAVMRKLDGAVELSTAQGKSILDSIEKIAFTDTDTIDIDTFINSQNPLMPIFNAIVQGKKVAATPEKYSGAVDFLEFQLLGNAEGNVVTGSEFNDFLNLLDGDDAANGGAGRDVLDGGTGSNFLTGGGGDDTFFLDGRGGSTTWSTITDFDGDNVNIWGWIDGTSQLLISEENAGADGFKGATLHFDLNNDGDIDTSITFSGLALNEVPEGIANMVETNGYLLFS